MKFLCLLFVVGFFLAVKAHDSGLDPEEKLQAEEALESLPELQHQDQILEDGVPEYPENFDGFDDCNEKGYECYLLVCPRGTVTVGSCNAAYRCCKSDD